MRPSDASAAAFRGRQARLAEWLKRAGIHACVIDDFENQRCSSLRWLSGHPMDALLFIFASGVTVLVPWDVNMAQERSVVDQVIPYTDLKRSSREAVKTVLREHGVEASVGGPRARRKVEFPGRTSHLRYRELQDDMPGAEILLRSDGFESFIGKARTVKDAGEIAALEKAAEITNALIDTIAARLGAPDIDSLRELDMAQLIEREALTLGAEGLGFETLAAGPSRSWAIHPFPSCSGGPFAGPGFSILDFGVKVDGYTSDVTLTIARGRLSAEQERMIALVEEAYGAAVDAAKPGGSPQAPAWKADQVFSAAGWKMPHSLGHGIGLDTHEAPLLRSQGESVDPELLPGMVFTIEPGLYHPEHGGVRWENDVLITEKGARVLTRAMILRV
ncbi:MAG: Xaa-Pro peptidase family protein [Spirochaetia bacterium]